MSAAWAVALPASKGAAAGRLRLCVGVEACACGDQVWLRGREYTDDLGHALRKLPAVGRYTVAADGRLTAVGARVPKGMLPAGPWHALAEWVSPQVQTAALPGAAGDRVPLRVVRSAAAAEPSILRTRIDAWADCVRAAPLVRLQRLTFAMAPDGQVIVRGRPLPAIGGTRYVESGGVAVPCGWALSPAVGAAAVRRLLGLGAGELALMATDATWDRVAAGSFAQASRSAVRLSLQRWRDG